MAPGIGRRGRRGRGRGSYVTQGRRGSSATQGGHGNSASQGGCGSSVGGYGGFVSHDGRGGSVTQGGHGSFSSQGGCGSSTSLGDPSATTSGSGAICGPTCGKKTVLSAKSATGGKLPVTFDTACRQPICVNAERFNNEIGYILRHHDIFYHKEWRLVPGDERAPL
ncbi:hypothetical protein PanWU01x14_002910 [Parasponia andersonii]|uniref:Uncharacterized protein n=1 Tax=Parasponia andersonii TaxID=3476 RepID=A0A2P5E5A6_PARAD|nr:hypothetical protein PanWU01x14_002910 [Parasponia andersonii]